MNFYWRRPVLKIFQEIITPLTCCPVSPGFLLWLSEGIDCALGGPLTGLTLLVTHPLTSRVISSSITEDQYIYFCHVTVSLELGSVAEELLGQGRKAKMLLSWIPAKMRTADGQLHDITPMSRIYIFHSIQLIVDSHLHWVYKQYPVSYTLFLLPIIIYICWNI